MTKREKGIRMWTLGEGRTNLFQLNGLPFSVVDARAAFYATNVISSQSVDGGHLLQRLIIKLWFSA